MLGCVPVDSPTPLMPSLGQIQTLKLQISSSMEQIIYLIKAEIIESMNVCFILFEMFTYIEVGKSVAFLLHLPNM
jgi:hypothetical protein